jgi:hypothetical protein
LGPADGELASESLLIFHEFDRILSAISIEVAAKYCEIGSRQQIDTLYDLCQRSPPLSLLGCLVGCK